MTDPELTPAQAEAVRRLLAEARSDEPMPDAVAQRLGGVIDDLAATRAAEGKPGAGATVVPLRRRRWPKVLVAAASVCAIGFGLTQYVGTGGDGVNMDGAGQSADEAGGTADDSPADDGRASALDRDRPDGVTGTDAQVPGAAAETRGDLTREEASLSQAFSAASRKLDLRLKPLDGAELAGSLITLQRGAQKEAARRPNYPWFDSYIRQYGKAEEFSTSADASTDRLHNLSGNVWRAAGFVAPACGPVYAVPRGRVTFATYKKKLALVLFYPKVNDVQLVEVFVCGSKTPRQAVRSVTLWDGE